MMVLQLSNPNICHTLISTLPKSGHFAELKSPKYLTMHFTVNPRYTCSSCEEKIASWDLLECTHKPPSHRETSKILQTILRRESHILTEDVYLFPKSIHWLSLSISKTTNHCNENSIN